MFANSGLHLQPPGFSFCSQTMEPKTALTLEHVDVYALLLCSVLPEFVPGVKFTLHSCYIECS